MRKDWEMGGWFSEVMVEVMRKGLAVSRTDGTSYSVGAN